MLTKLQMSLYWREWAKARAAIEQMRGEVLTSNEANEERHLCHTNAGAPESSKDLNNKQFDAVLASFFAWSHSASLAHQGRQLDMPVTRCRYVIDDLCDRIVAMLVVQDRAKQAEGLHEGRARDGYVRYLLKRASGQDLTALQDYPTAAWTKVISMLTIRYDQVSRQGNGTGSQKRTRPIDGAQDMSQSELGMDAPRQPNRWDLHTAAKRQPQPVVASDDDQPF